MNHFLSCDWGTTSFRLRWVDTVKLHFDTIETNDKGIGIMFDRWQQSGAGDRDRFGFYFEVIADQIRKLEDRLKQSLSKAPLVISGMASSSIGMLELDYRSVPFSASGAGFDAMRIRAHENIQHDVIVIPGIRSDNDAARGQETQLIGCDHDPEETRIFIFPGTHSKHIWVEKSEVTGIRTYMTGEFFELLSSKSILSHSIEKGQGFENGNNRQAFENGVSEGMRSNILNAAFAVRTNDLFKKLSKERNYYFLSGLLIGAELSGLINERDKGITLVASPGMMELYLDALHVVMSGSAMHSLRLQKADEALVRGQLQMLRNMGYHY
jgi:2-dehydro-3-deoxygalactonokinase